MYWNARLNAAGKQRDKTTTGGSLSAATASRRVRLAVPCGYGHWHWGSKQSELNH
jgi:hypothetical protein